MKEIQEHIEQYQSWGFSVFPVIPHSKKPMVVWKKYQSHKPNDDEVNEWIERPWSRGANIAIVCGKVSGNLIVLDFDSEPAWLEFSDEWKKRKSQDIIEVTPIVKTTRGYHVYIRCKQVVKKQKLDCGIDIQGERSFVVAPPSISATGHRYHFLNPKVTQILAVNDLSELGIEIQLDTENIKPPFNTEDVLDGVPEGKRDYTCYSQAKKHIEGGLNRQNVLDLLLDWAGRCTPPFPRDQVEKCINSAYQHIDEGKLTQQPVPIVLQQPQEPVNEVQVEKLAKARKTVTKWLKLKGTNIIDVALATIVANKAPGDPVWLLIVGAPSTGKSEILRGLFDCKNVHQLGGFSANTFVSGMKDVKAGLLERLPDETVLVIKDFGTLLTMRYQEKSVILQQLREIYDGEYTKEYGNEKIVHWKGRMGLLGAVTTAIDGHHAVIGELGNRYVLYRFKTSTDMRDEIAYLALNDAGLEKQMREEISEAFKAAVDNIPASDTMEIPDAIKHKLTSLANLVARLRSPVSRDAYHKSVNWQPDIEGPSRLVKVFAKLGKGLSALRGLSIMTDSEYQVVSRVGRDTVQQSRIKVIKYLLDGKWHPAKDISFKLNMSPATLTLLLEDLLQIGAVTRQAEIEREKLTRTTPYMWKIKKSIADLITQTGLL